MKAYWKYLIQTAGYKSLKSTYIKTVQDKWATDRSKKEAYTHFQWIIGRAKHYAHHTGKPIGQILNEWEHKRTYCWKNFYQDYNQPKFHSKSVKRKQRKGITKKTKQRWTIAKKKRRY